MDIDKLINSRLFIENQFESSISEYNLNLNDKETIPFAVTFDPKINEELDEQKGELSRCTNSKCKAYINKYVRIYEPGNRWKCNICYTVNILEEGNKYYIGGGDKKLNYPSDDFNPMKNAEINKKIFNEYAELSSSNYKSFACNKFIFKKPEKPTFIFLLEATENSLSKGIFELALSSILKGIDNIENLEESRFIFSFYSKHLYLFNKKQEFLIIPQVNEIPYLQIENLIFSYTDLKNISIESMKKFFYEENYKSQSKSDLAGPLSILSSFCTESILSIFLVSNVNCGPGIIYDSNTFEVKNDFYKNITKILIARQISVNIFFSPIDHIPVHQLSVLTRHTGGNLYLYSALNNSAETIANKYCSDIIKDISLNRSVDTVCRIRVSDPFIIKEHYGSFYIRQSELLGYPALSPNQTINFSFELLRRRNLKFESNGITFQIVILRSTLIRERFLHIYNYHIPIKNDIHFESFYSGVNPFMLTRYFACKNIMLAINKNFNAVNAELKRQSEILIFNYRKNTNYHIGDINSQIKFTTYLLNSLMKTIPFRNTSYTPLMFRSMYFFYFLTASYKFTSKIIYPVLVELFDNEGSIDPRYVALKNENIKNNNIYLLDCGTYIFIYIGRDISNKITNEIISTDNFKNGRYMLESRESDLSKIIQEFLIELETEISQLIYVIIDRDEYYEKRKDLKVSDQCIYKNIFYSYLTDDRCHNNLSMEDFYKEIIFSVQKLIK